MSISSGRLPTRERILRAAVHLFQAGGYHATGVVEILERAEAPKGSFYHHVPGGKEALAAAALAGLQGEIVAFLDSLAAEGGSSDDMVRGLARYIVNGLLNPCRNPPIRTSRLVPLDLTAGFPILHQSDE